MSLTLLSCENDRHQNVLHHPRWRSGACWKHDEKWALSKRLVAVPGSNLALAGEMRKELEAKESQEINGIEWA